MIIVYTTFPDWKSAEETIKKLLEEKLIACANLREHKAFYWWEGRLEEGNEVGALLKTKVELWKSVRERLKELHPYRVPAIIRIDVDNVNAEYLNWLLEVLR
ncbi:divalent-cation tolerance protein CutA [Thermococcus sp.]